MSDHKFLYSGSNGARQDGAVLGFTLDALQKVLSTQTIPDMFDCGIVSQDAIDTATPLCNASCTSIPDSDSGGISPRCGTISA